MTESIEFIELGNQILEMRNNYKEIVDYYEFGKLPKYVSDATLIKYSYNNPLSEAELLKISNYIARGGDKNKMKMRLDELNLRPVSKLQVKIDYSTAKKMYENLNAIYELKFENEINRRIKPSS